ncbi:MAG: hypothetical protein EZS28_040103 [Streblomastix strix]|uniref:non-specific serine/threonine protein kinase n=1 Tax=Streblomastix strix TaxID=222440 RepID=A0A5J4U2I0_9EUKA|nr:MAG: hypothetical protein EZS28_040103 [Streblomastix strix]
MEYCMQVYLKPENVLLVEGFQVKLADFGLARQLQVGREYITAQGVFSKNQKFSLIRKDKKFNNKTADIWAFGVMIFELIVQHHPFFDNKSEADSSIEEHIHRVIDLPPVELPENYPLNLRNLVKQILEKQKVSSIFLKLQQHCILPQGTLTQIVRRDWIASLKFNLCTFISIYDTIYKVNMTRALKDTTEQGNLLKTQPSPEIRSGYNNQMIGLNRRTGLGTEEADCTTSYRHDQEQTRDNATRMSSGSSEKTDTRNPVDCVFTTTESITTHPQQQIQGQYQPQYPFQHSGQQMQYLIQPVQFPVILSPNQFLPTMNPPQTQTSEPRLPSNETIRDQKVSIQPSQQMEQAAIQTVERRRQSTTSTRNVHNMLIPPIPAYPQQQIPLCCV